MGIGKIGEDFDFMLSINNIIKTIIYNAHLSTGEANR